MTDPTTPVDRLRAEITERLDATRTLLYWAQHTNLTLTDPRLLGKEIPGWHDWPDVERLAEWGIGACERDLRVLRRHSPEPNPSSFEDKPRCAGCTHEPIHSPWPCWNDWPCEEITDMAGVYLPAETLSGGDDG